jgi:hypothetical protein
MRCGLLPPDAAAAAPLASKLVAPTRLVSPNMATQLYGAPRGPNIFGLSREKAILVHNHFVGSRHTSAPPSPRPIITLLRRAR